LACGFISAVADRFGLWGPPGASGVVWGDWATFVDYVAVLNPYASPSLVPILGWIATVAEILLGVGLLFGWQLRRVALLSGLLMLSFALAMTYSLGVKAPLDYSVLGVTAAAFLLASIQPATDADSDVTG